MTGELAIPTALDLLRRQLGEGAEAADLLLPLRALQMRGLNQLDLTVHVERLRATNDASEENEQFEERCLLALEIIHGGLPRYGLVWDAAHDAASLLARCLSSDDVRRAMPFALVPSDLLPPRSALSPENEGVVGVLASAVESVISTFELLPQRAELIRAPKTAFTTRPAAILAFPDRVALEALTSAVEDVLHAALPREVVWPRNRTEGGSSSYSRQILEWKSQYVVKADIAHFYESVEHSLLAVFLSSRLGISVVTARAVEAVLTATMGLSRGLPQGPAASDILASAYLLPVDQSLASLGRPYLRYADDYFMPAEDVGDGRAVLQRLEALLGELGLSLNPAKTSVMRATTFQEALERRTVRALKQSILTSQLEQLEDVEDANEAAEVLETAGVPDETIWDLLYHHSVTVEDAIDQLLGVEESSVAKAYAFYFHAVAWMLRRDEQLDDLTAVASLAFECLALLSQTDVELQARDLGEVQKWFPHLTPQIAEYLTSVTRPLHESAVAYIHQHLAFPSGVDWVDAWMCHAAGRLPEGKAPVAALRKIAEGPAAPLASAEAVRSLALHADIEEPEWQQAYERAGPALASEMLFAGLDLRDQVPWLARYARDAENRGIAAIAGALEPSKER